MRRTVGTHLRRGAVVTAAAAGLALLPTGANAAPAETAPVAAAQQQDRSEAAETCGWWTNAAGAAYYTHCASAGKIIIHVVSSFGDYEQCVGPGTTFLGQWPATSGAWYAGRTC